MSKNYKTLSDDAIALLCGLIREVQSVGDAIDDINLGTNCTFSSVRIQHLMDALSEEDRRYAENLVGNLKRLVTEVVDVIPTIDTAQTNTLYLYKDPSDTGNTYEQYMLIDGTIITLGTTDVNLDNFYDKQSTDDKFATKVDLQGVVDTVPQIVPILQADYNLLTENEKNADNIIYNITDKNTDLETLNESLANVKAAIYKGMSETIQLTETGLQNVRVVAYKYGNMVQLRFIGDFTTDLTLGRHEICTLPSEYIPKQATQQFLSDSSGNNIASLTILTTGEMTLYVFTAPTIARNFAYNNITYIGSY